jgi:hypothetical protein
MSYSSSAILFFCVYSFSRKLLRRNGLFRGYSLQQEHAYRIVAYQWSYSGLSRKRELAGRWLAMDYSDFPALCHNMFQFQLLFSVMQNKTCSVSNLTSRLGIKCYVLLQLNITVNIIRILDRKSSFEPRPSDVYAYHIVKCYTCGVYLTHFPLLHMFSHDFVLNK